MVLQTMSILKNILVYPQCLLSTGWLTINLNYEYVFLGVGSGLYQTLDMKSFVRQYSIFGFQQDGRGLMTHLVAS